jgi:hypothetical protein
MLGTHGKISPTHLLPRLRRSSEIRRRIRSPRNSVVSILVVSDRSEFSGAVWRSDLNFLHPFSNHDDLSWPSSHCGEVNRPLNPMPVSGTSPSTPTALLCAVLRHPGGSPITFATADPTCAWNSVLPETVPSPASGPRADRHRCKRERGRLPLGISHYGFVLGFRRQHKRHP